MGNESVRPRIQDLKSYDVVWVRYSTGVQPFVVSRIIKPRRRGSVWKAEGWRLVKRMKPDAYWRPSTIDDTAIEDRIEGELAAQLVELLEEMQGLPKGVLNIN